MVPQTDTPAGGRQDDDVPDAVPDWQMDPDIVPTTLPEPDSVDDGDEEDGRV